MKMYNEIISRFNESTGEWEDVYEDSFDYTGPIAFAGITQGNWGALGAGPGRVKEAQEAWLGLKDWAQGEEEISGITTKMGDTEKYKSMTPYSQIENVIQSGSGGALDTIGRGTTGAAGLPTSFNLAMTQGDSSPTKKIMNESESLLNKIGGDSGLGGKYSRQKALSGETLPTAKEAYGSGIITQQASLQALLDGFEDTLQGKKDAELIGMRDLASFYGGGDEYTSEEGVAFGDEGSGYTAQGPGTKIGQEQAALAAGLVSPLDTARGAAGDYGTALTGAGGLFGSGAQGGFGINPATGELNVSPEELYTTDDFGNISWNEGVNPSDYGGDVRDILNEIYNLDKDYDTRQEKTDIDFGKSKSDSARDIRLAKEGKLDYQNKLRRDVEQAKLGHAASGLTADTQRQQAGGLYSGPTERLIDLESKGRASSLRDIGSNYREGIRDKEQIIKNLFRDKEDAQGTYNQDISDMNTLRAQLMSDIPGKYSGLQETAESAFGSLSDIIGGSAASQMAGGLGGVAGIDGEADQTYSDLAENLSIQDILGVQPAMGADQPFNYTNMADLLGGGFGSAGQSLADQYTASQGRVEDIGTDYQTALDNLNINLGPATTTANANLELEKTLGPEKMKTALAGLRTGLVNPMQERADLRGVGPTIRGGEGVGVDNLGLAGLSTANQEVPTTHDLSSVGMDSAQDLMAALNVPLGDSTVGMNPIAPNIPASGTISQAEQGVKTPLDYLYEQTLSDDAKQYFHREQLSKPAEDIITRVNKEIGPSVETMKAGAAAEVAADSGHGDSFESNVLRTDYAKDDVGKFGGKKRGGLYGGSTKRGGAARQYFPRLVSDVGQDEWWNINSITNPQTILDASVVPGEILDYRTSIDQALAGLGMGANQNVKGLDDLERTGIGGDTGYMGSEAILDYAPTIEEQYLNKMGIPASANTMNQSGSSATNNAFVQYLIAQGLI
tara:strand:- start:3178 stop:6048 length:2871 start_codon:yes stop_codon:yes gene_type:complete